LSTLLFADLAESVGAGLLVSRRRDALRASLRSNRPVLPPATAGGRLPYTETHDQLAAIDEVKADMERPVPMDRVVSGDVGYGKTEIAVRAAFKAVQDGKQVVILVPTT
jgi:transcription-repair coupling factor (superfamily II helicase)